MATDAQDFDSRQTATIAFVYAISYSDVGFFILWAEAGHNLPKIWHRPAFMTIPPNYSPTFTRWRIPTPAYDSDDWGMGLRFTVWFRCALVVMPTFAAMTAVSFPFFFP